MMRSGVIPVSYGVLPAMKTTLPYSPRLLANAMVNPATSAGKTSGMMTLQNICTRDAQNISAVSSYSPSIFSSTGWTLLTTNGIPMNTSATVIPTLVYAMSMPNFANRLPVQPFFTVRCVSAIPATAVGSANGSSMIPSMIRFPGNLYRTSTHASTSPMTAFISNAISAVRRLTL